MNTSNLKTAVPGRFAVIFSALHSSLAIVGLLALIRLGMYVLHPDINLRGEGRATVFGTIRYEGNSLFEFVQTGAEDPRHRALATHLSRRYKIALDAAEQLVGAAFEAGQRVGIDPLLILAVVGVESGYNPIAESVMGAKGLMQVMPQYHQDKLDEHGGQQAVLDPVTNILVGTRILKEYIRRTGSLESGLQTYAGALSDTTGQYSQKVMAEKERLRQAVQRLERLVPATRVADSA